MRGGYTLYEYIPGSVDGGEAQHTTPMRRGPRTMTKASAANPQTRKRHTIRSGRHEMTRPHKTSTSADHHMTCTCTSEYPLHHDLEPAIVSHFYGTYILRERQIINGPETGYVCSRGSSHHGTENTTSHRPSSTDPTMHIVMVSVERGMHIT